MTQERGRMACLNHDNMEDIRVSLPALILTWEQCEDIMKPAFYTQDWTQPEYALSIQEQWFLVRKNSKGLVFLTSILPCSSITLKILWLTHCRRATITGDLFQTIIELLKLEEGGRHERFLVILQEIQGHSDAHNSPSYMEVFVGSKHETEITGDNTTTTKNEWRVYYANLSSQVQSSSSCEVKPLQDPPEGDYHCRHYNGWRCALVRRQMDGTTWRYPNSLIQMAKSTKTTGIG